LQINSLKRQKRVLVTGGAGFLGSHLIDRLLAAGHDVLCLDNLFSGTKANIAHHIANPNFQFMRHDICLPVHLEVDEIWNLACPASPIYYQHDPVQTTKTSVLGAINVLGMAKRLECPVFQASTSEVYGDPDVSPQSEAYWGNVNPIGIRSCYDEGKRCAEALFFDYHREHGVNIKIARIFNTYGPRMRPDDGRVVSNFIVQALRGEDITIYGDGSHTRSFCYVDDLIDGFEAFMQSSPSFLGPVNLGSSFEFTISQLAQTIIGLSGSRSKIVYLPLPSDDPKQRRPDTTLAAKELGWEPKIELEDGISRTIEYFKELING